MGDDKEPQFLEEMADVVPLKREPRVSARGKPVSDRDTSQALRRASAEHGPQTDRNTLTEDDVEPLDAWYVLDYKRAGVQNGVFRKLKQGRYDAEARLDLHRMTVKKARRELFGFLEEAVELGLRTVLILHGKGQSAVEQERCSILKGATDKWLRELDAVQAFHSAQPRHGGTGAVYVLLRKSEAKKRENRERFAKGRVPHNLD
ncbi:MAG: DNA endonuclease SmrA [Pseudomonadota bacterium]